MYKNWNFSSWLLTSRAALRDVCVQPVIMLEVPGAAAGGLQGAPVLLHPGPTLTLWCHMKYSGTAQPGRNETLSRAVPIRIPPAWSGACLPELVALLKLDMDSSAPPPPSHPVTLRPSSSFPANCQDFSSHLHLYRCCSFFFSTPNQRS